jgi:hypothetical protein
LESLREAVLFTPARVGIALISNYYKKSNLAIVIVSKPELQVGSS